jgi:hypothetical protein
MTTTTAALAVIATTAALVTIADPLGHERTPAKDQIPSRFTAAGFLVKDTLIPERTGRWVWPLAPSRR